MQPRPPMAPYPYGAPPPAAAPPGAFYPPRPPGVAHGIPTAQVAAYGSALSMSAQQRDAAMAAGTLAVAPVLRSLHHDPIQQRLIAGARFGLKPGRCPSTTLVRALNRVRSRGGSRNIGFSFKARGRLLAALVVLPRFLHCDLLPALPNFCLVARLSSLPPLRESDRTVIITPDPRLTPAAPRPLFPPAPGRAAALAPRSRSSSPPPPRTAATSPRAFGSRGRTTTPSSAPRPPSGTWRSRFRTSPSRCTRGRRWRRRQCGSCWWRWS